jgi:hypothetical protein
MPCVDDGAGHLGQASEAKGAGRSGAAGHDLGQVRLLAA